MSGYVVVVLVNDKLGTTQKHPREVIMEILCYIVNVITLVFLLSKFVDWKIAMHEWENDLGDTNKASVDSYSISCLMLSGPSRDKGKDRPNIKLIKVTSPS